MSEKKKQHVIPKCYLKAWCDPRTPAGQHPYIWRISRDGTEKSKRSPDKSFVATDKYTIKLPTGKRNLIIENTLAGIENDFVGVLSRIRRRQALNRLDRARLCLFTAALHTRTVSMGEHWKRQYQDLHDVVTALEHAHGAAPSTSLQTGKMVEYAHQHIIATAVEMETPLLFEMEMAVLVTDSEGFITSDSPCVWFNPKLHTFPPFYRSPGLGQPDIEVTLPLSPHHLLFISHHRPATFYVDVEEKHVDEANRLTRFHCDKEFVSWKGETRPYWFERGQEPENTWEKSEAGKKALEENERVVEGLAGRESTEK